MKAFLAGVATTAVLVICFSVWRSVRDAEWIISAIKSPGIMALRDIQADMNANRYDLAKNRVDLFLQTYEKFSAGPDSCSGTGIRDVVLAFSNMPGGNSATNVEPNAAVNQSQPVRSEANSSKETGSHR